MNVDCEDGDWIGERISVFLVLIIRPALDRHLREHSDYLEGPRVSDSVERHHLHTEAHTQYQLRLWSVLGAAGG